MKKIIAIMALFLCTPHILTAGNVNKLGYTFNLVQRDSMTKMYFKQTVRPKFTGGLLLYATTALIAWAATKDKNYKGSINKEPLLPETLLLGVFAGSYLMVKNAQTWFNDWKHNVCDDMKKLDSNDLKSVYKGLISFKSKKLPTNVLETIDSRKDKINFIEKYFAWDIRICLKHLFSDDIQRYQDALDRWSKLDLPTDLGSDFVNEQCIKAFKACKEKHAHFAQSYGNPTTDEEILKLIQKQLKPDVVDESDVE